jgi:hypothetical protein
MSKRSKLVIIPLLFAILNLYLFFVPSFSPHAKASWYNTSYLYKKKITLSHTKVGLPTKDVGAIAQGGSVSSLTFSLTATNLPNNILVVGVATLNSSVITVSSVTYNGTNLTQLSSQTNSNCIS